MADLDHTWGCQQMSAQAATALLCFVPYRPMSVATSAAAVADAPVAAPVLPYRVGHGFDLHRLAEGYKLVIGGIEIPHTKGCEAHSDGMLGAAAVNSLTYTRPLL